MRLAVGYFDGVHLGHQAILRGADRALTFRNHPLTLLAPEKAPRLIMSLEERLSAIGRPVEVLDFTPELAAMSPEQFAARYLRGCVVSCGANWRFGCGGVGDGAWLRAHGYAVDVATSVEYAGATISSSRIRAALGRGDLAAANAMLGRPFAVSGRIVRGKGEGKALGYPTVNVVLRADMPEIPCGVYEVEVAGVRAIANYGHAPTFRDRCWPTPVLEIHFQPFNLDLQPFNPLALNLLRFIRPERKFDSVEDLKRQIAADCASLQPFNPPTL